MRRKTISLTLSAEDYSALVRHAIANDVPVAVQARHAIRQSMRRWDAQKDEPQVGK